MASSPSDRIVRALTLAAAAAGGLFVVAYAGVAIARLGYPYELEWMEGGMVEHVRRVLAGQPIYAKPSLEFVSFFYPPLYDWAAAVLSSIFGVGFVPLRLLSFASSLGVLALLFRMARRETASAWAGWLAASLFAATYARAGAWFDLARLDSFYLLLLLASLELLAGGAGTVAAAAGGALLAAAFFTKQSAAVVAAGMFAGALLADRKRGVWFAGTAAAIVAAGILALQRATGGWFAYYCFEVPRHHPRLEGGLTLFWTSDVLPALPFAVVLAAAGVVVAVRGPGGGRRLLVPCTAAGMIASSWSVRDVVGAEVNNLLPAFAAISLLAVLGLKRGIPAVQPAAPGSAWRGILAGAAAALLLAQLGWLTYDPRRFVPSAADRAAGDRLVERLKKIDGEVFIPHHGYLARLAGKRAYAHTLAMDNLYLDDTGPARRDLEAEMRQALAEKRFGAVIMESDGRYGVAILNSYEAREALFDSPDVFWPVCGGRLRPEALCLPR